MDVSKVKRIIGQCSDTAELNAIKATITRRLKVLGDRAYAETKVKAWARAKDWKPGQVVYCCAAGMFLGGPVQRGDSATVTHIQPRAKRVWMTLVDGGRFYYAVAGLVRYNWREEPPAKSISEGDRADAEAVGRAFGV